MKKYIQIIIITIVFPIVTVFAEPICKYYGIRDKEADKIFKLEQEADISIHYSPHNKKIDIDVGELKGFGRDPITFSLSELESFFENQKHKNFIVVWFNKSMLEEVVLSEHVNELNDYFFKLGYKRVMLLQGMGAGVGLYTDKINQNNNI